ncbi:MAG: response regulator transcription factor [Acidimicrobiia bacterium]|nr:response regulator transcription factor [Acidimicrobiia bacterium]MDH3470581.1 response regulator transcription factor [Acidimicrobiia bacterium]
MEATVTAAKHGTVLLIEDDDDIAELVRLFFEKEGFRLVHAATGEAGIERVRDRGVRAILLDIGLPGMDGIEVCKAVRAISDVPVIMLTARDSEIDKVVGLEIGADDYVTKPFSGRELVARVRAVLRRSEERPVVADSVEVGGFVIDAGRREVVMPSGEALRPTAREFDLLWYLAENQGLVLSRGQILESVWGYEYFGETRTVDVHVRQLRKKLPDIPIETVWGVGYRLGD